MKNNIKYIIIVTAMVFTALLSSCGNNHIDEDGHNHETVIEPHSEDDGHNQEVLVDEVYEESGIHLTQDQVETIGLEFGNFSSVKVNEFVKTTGTLGLPPNAYSSAIAKASGIIKDSKRFIEGNYIKKGEIVAYVENPEFINRQKEYLKTKATLEFLRQDLSRQKELAEANAGVERTLQKIQSEVVINEAELQGTAKYLNYLGISVSSLSPNNISQRIAIVAPMSGYITSVNLHNGMYVEPNMELMQIISNSHLHLELDVFEKDIAKIKPGQKISYSIPALGNTSYEGEVSVIAKEFDVTNKTVRIHGHLGKEKPQFIKDLFVNGKIWLTDITSPALPEKAIIRDEGTSFIYVAENDSDKEEIEFQKIMVIPGTTNNGFTSVKIIDEIPNGLEIVTKGAYYVYAKSKAGSLEHEH